MATLGIFTRDPRTDEDQQPFGRILAAVMRGNAMVQGQQQAKEVASDQMDANARMSVTISRSKTGGPPIVNLKNAPADMLNGTQDSDVQQAHDTPHQNVEKKLDQMGIGTGASQAAFLRSHGFEPFPTSAKPEELGSFRGVFRAQRAIGENPFVAFGDALATKAHLISPEREAIGINRAGALQNTEAEAAIGQGIAPEIAMANAGSAQQRLAFERERVGIADEKENRVVIDNAIKNIDYGKISFARWRETTEGELGRPLTDAEWSKVREKGSRDVNANLDSFLGKENPMQRAALGSYDTFDAAKQAYGGDVPPARERQFFQTWKAAHDEYQKKDAKERATIDLEKTRLDVARQQVTAQQQSNAIMAAAQRGTGEAAIANLPDQTKQLVRGIASGQLDITKVTTARGGQRQSVAQLVASYDPSWSTAVAPARAATYRDFTSGKSFQNIVRINTATHHLDTLISAADQLQNADTQLWNLIKNKGLSAVGDPRVTRFNAAATAVEGELAAVFKGTGATDQEIKSVSASLNSAQSPRQMQAAINTLIELMGGRAQSLSDAYQAGMGQAPPPNLIFSAQSESILQKHGINLNVGGAKAASAGQPMSRDELLDFFGKKKGKK